MKRTISAVLCAALALTLAGCAEEKEPMLDQTVTVETTAAQPGELSTESTYIGTISAEGTASVVSLVSGNVEEVMVSVGDTVSAGDPLCRIDDDDTAFFMHQFRQLLYRISAAKDIGNLRHRCNLCLFCHQGFHILIPVGTIRLTFQINELRTCLSGYHLPRQDIAVVVINAD